MSIDTFPPVESWRQKTLADIEPIEESFIIPASREHLDEIVELPVLEACKILFDKGIRTLMSSANYQDLISGNAHIIIDFEHLSDENKVIAESLGTIDTRTGFFRVQTIKVEIPVDKNMKIGGISDEMIKKSPFLNYKVPRDRALTLFSPCSKHLL